MKDEPIKPFFLARDLVAPYDFESPPSRDDMILPPEAHRIKSRMLKPRSSCESPPKPRDNLITPYEPPREPESADNFRDPAWSHDVYQNHYYQGIYIGDAAMGIVAKVIPREDLSRFNVYATGGDNGLKIFSMYSIGRKFQDFLAIEGSYHIEKIKKRKAKSRLDHYGTPRKPSHHGRFEKLVEQTGGNFVMCLTLGVVMIRKGLREEYRPAREVMLREVRKRGELTDLYDFAGALRDYCVKRGGL